LAKSIYKSIKKCLKDLGLESEISVALLLGGEWKAGSDTKEKSNIIVTNIDNFEINTFRNKRKRIAIQHLNRTCIFDEFHSYMCNAPLMFSFASTIRERLMCKNIKTVLMSATPIYDRCFVKEDDVEQININDDNFANRQIRFTFDTSKEDAIKKYYGGTLVDKDVLVVACTILSADFIHEIVNDMLYSRFTESDKKEKLENLLTYKGKENRVNYSLSSTNIFMLFIPSVSV
jgi:CRISPR/Cas system-associated endonuclease/helicase Cas3